MTPFALFLCRHYLPKLLSHACGSEIPRSGKEGENVNCFSVKIDDNGAPFFWVRSITGDELKGFRWDAGSSSFSIQSSINLKAIEPHQDFFITHYYGLADVRYRGIFDLAIGRITRWPYIKINVVTSLNRFDQYWFNKKKLITKQRMDLLNLLIQKHLDGKTPIDSFELMNDLYSQKWILHPDGTAQHRKLKFYLDSLVQSGEVQEIDDHHSVIQYSVTPHALPKIEEYEEDERRHTENVKMQRRMVLLTVLILFLTCVQAGLIKMPPLLDFSNWPLW